MKTYIHVITLATFMLGGLTSCNAFLDREPLDEVTPEKFFTTEAELAAYSINNYRFVTVDASFGIGIFKADNDTDNQAGEGNPSFWLPGLKQVSAQAGNDGYKWEDVRSCNYFFDQVIPRYEEGSILGNQNNIKHYIGEMYVNRAYAYFQKMKKYGDLPIVTTALPDIEEVLMKAAERQPRHKVARFILEDLKKAEELLLNVAPGGKNRISKNVAYLLHARVALYEATWEKYHRGTAFVPGGQNWPGKDAQGYEADTEINYFLDEAIAASKVVGDQMVGNLVNNTDTREGMYVNMTSLNPYYTMFCDQDMEKYSEMLMWKRFDESQKVTGNLQMELTRNGGGSGWTRGMVNSFLMRNGLPIYAPNSGYNTEWEKEGVNATLQNRDSRISIFTKMPGDVNFYQTDGQPAICQISLIFGDAGSKATTGFIVKKGKHYDAHMAQDHDASTSGGIVFRGTEAMLIYMEASYEKNRVIDATAGEYWRALRIRAKVDPDYQKTIHATVMTEEAKGDWGAYSHGQLIDPTLYNIRRERRNELCGEPFRWDDLKRWRALDQMKNDAYRVEGMLYWGSKYEEELKDLCVVDPVKGNMSSPEMSKYIVPYEKITTGEIAKQHGFRFTPAHYLEPISVDIFRQTALDKNDFTSSVVYQNPGWGYQASTGATDLE